MGRLNHKWKLFYRKIFAAAEWPLIRFGFLVVSPLSRKGVLRLARVLACIGMFFDRRGRSYAEANILYVFPNLSEKRRRAILIGCYRNITRVLLDVFWFGRDSEARVRRWAPISDSWRTFLELEGPKVIVTAHQGNWEMAAHVVVTNGFPLMSVGKALGTERTIQQLNQFRARLGQEIVLSEGAVRPLLRTLKRGGNIALLADQHLSMREGGIWSVFLGHKGLTAPTPAFFAQRSGATLGVGYLKARADGSYWPVPVIVFSPKKDESLEALTQRVSDASSRLIRRFPTQWLFAYKRWQDIPEGESAADYPFYARPICKD